MMTLTKFSGQERKGNNSQVNMSEIHEFGYLINNLNLVDLPSLGNKYNWFDSGRSVVSILDSFFLYYLKVSLRSRILMVNLWEAWKLQIIAQFGSRQFKRLGSKTFQFI